jgi:serine/threonine-protein kinase
MLSHYRLVEKIGEGGMGVVWKADDTVLGRQVAIKVLPDDFAHDAERLARFRQEARLLASLNHPNIAAIYGLEEDKSGGVRYLVLELVPGQTLAERLWRGPLPIDDALAVCRQIAEALEAAHEKGIIHRDLKPGNVKVTPDGKVKVLDFGLAKAFEADAASGGDLSQSPTLTSPPTRAGVLLGTAAYMSPEQARGKPLDKRTDIWSFGCVLYELLAGKQAFSGETASDTIAKILEREPDWKALPAQAPGSVRRLLSRCLQKDSARRVRDVWDARIEIEQALSGPPSSDEEGVSTSGSTTTRSGALWIKAVSLAVLLAVATGLGVWRLSRRSAPSRPQPVGRFVLNIPESTPLATGELKPTLAVSPNGSRLVYVARHSGERRLFVRALNSLEAQVLPGTEGAREPFFSRDGLWIGFFADAKLKKVSVLGGMPVVLCDVQDAWGGTWSEDGSIYFARSASGLHRVSGDGGTPENIPVPALTRQNSAFIWPKIISGRKAVLLSIYGGGSSEQAQIGVVSLDTGEGKVLVDGGVDAHFLPTGHLVYAVSGALMGVPFDLQRLEVAGPPVRVQEGVLMDTEWQMPHFDVSESGVLAYVPGSGEDYKRSLLWVDRGGSSRPVMDAEHAFYDVQLSPDGRRLAVSMFEKAANVHIYDLDRRMLTQLTFEEHNAAPIWSPDGEWVAFASSRTGFWKPFWKPADGSGAAERLLNSEERGTPFSWSPDGQVLAYVGFLPNTQEDLMMLPLQGQREPRPFLSTPFNEGEPMFSPDGRWIAYQSDESGRFEIYVRPYPGPGGKWQVSTEGGASPRWRRDGRELFYRKGGKLMVVSTTTRPSFKASPPQELFEGPYLGSYDVAPDGQRFVMIKRDDREDVNAQVNVVLNWTEELKRLVPTESH